MAILDQRSQSQIVHWFLKRHGMAVPSIVLFSRRSQERILNWAICHQDNVANNRNNRATRHFLQCHLGLAHKSLRQL